MTSQLQKTFPHYLGYRPIQNSKCQNGENHFSFKFSMPKDFSQDKNDKWPPASFALIFRLSFYPEFKNAKTEKTDINTKNIHSILGTPTSDQDPFE